MRVVTTLSKIMLFVMVALVASSYAFGQLQLIPAKGESAEPKRASDKIDIAYKFSRFYLAGGTAFDDWTTVRGLHHPTFAYRADGSFLTRYYVRETGWAGVLGNRNSFAAVSFNSGLNYGLDWFDRRLYRRGGGWRIVATVLNFSKGTYNNVCAGGNIRFWGSIDNQVRSETGYHGPVHWR